MLLSHHVSYNTIGKSLTFESVLENSSLLNFPEKFWRISKDPVKVKVEEEVSEIKETPAKEKLELKTSPEEEENEAENSSCDRDVRLGEKGEFGVFPLISFPGSGNT